MRPSQRFLWPAALVCLLAAAAVWSGKLRPRAVETCRSPQELRSIERIPNTRGARERVESLTRNLFQWTEGTLQDAKGRETALHVHVVRDFQGTRFFQRPFALGGALEPETQSTRRVESAAGPLVIHRVHDGTSRLTHGVERLAVYTFLYGNEPVASAVRPKLRHGLDELLKGRRPLTLLLVAGAAPAGRAEALRARAEQWLRDASARYVSVCGEA